MRWSWLVSITPRTLYPWGNSPWYLLKRRLGGSRSLFGWFGEEKISCPCWNLKTKNKIIMYLVIHTEISIIKTHNTCLYGSNPTVLTNKQTTLILSHTTQVYLKSSCAFACILHVLALPQAIVRHVSTKISWNFKICSIHAKVKLEFKKPSAVFDRKSVIDLHNTCFSPSYMFQVNI